jgi:hypothetical protein
MLTEPQNPAPLSCSYLLVVYTYLLEVKKALCHKGYLGVGVRKGVRNPCSQPTYDIPRKWLNCAIKRVSKGVRNGCHQPPFATPNRLAQEPDVAWASA